MSDQSPVGKDSNFSRLLGIRILRAENGEAELRMAMQEQFQALSAPSYRVTVMEERDGKKVAQNLGKRSGEDERLFSAEELIQMVPRLTALNARGGNVFLTPIDPDAWHILLDDASADGVEELRKRGFSPSLVMESSPGNYQAVIKVPRKSTDKDHANLFFKDLNRDLGDPKITGLVRPMRLAGFQNRKPKHATADGGRPPLRRQITNASCSLTATMSMPPLGELNGSSRSRLIASAVKTTQKRSSSVSSMPAKGSLTRMDCNCSGVRRNVGTS